MRKSLLCGLGLGLVVTIAVQGCSREASSPSGASSPSPSAIASSAETGTLKLRANGEDFVRQGFISKDGWKIAFDHVYVTLSNIKAYQADPPYDAQSNEALRSTQVANFGQTQTVDLAQGDANAEPVLVATIAAPAGRYNALSWTMPKATAGEAAGTALMLVGTASKDGKSLPFTLKVDQEMAYQCGEFVGDERKGLLKAGDTADLEATFHFDHMFGDADLPPKDELNQKALGFGPLAAIAQAGQVNADVATLKQSLSSEDFEKFLTILPSLGHVGEGHCKETMLTQR